MSGRMNLLVGIVLGLMGAAAVRTLAIDEPRLAVADTGETTSGWVGATGPVSNGRSVLYLFDTQKKHLLVYDSQEGRNLRLVAARKCEYDAEIVDWVNPSPTGSGPEVLEIKARLEAERFKAKDEAKKPK